MITASTLFFLSRPIPKDDSQFSPTQLTDLKKLPLPAKFIEMSGKIMPKATLYRLLKAGAAAGYVRKDEHDVWRFRLASAQTGEKVLTDAEIRAMLPIGWEDCSSSHLQSSFSRVEKKHGISRGLFDDLVKRAMLKGWLRKSKIDDKLVRVDGCEKKTRFVEPFPEMI